jgi:hypothetical protein
MSWSDPVTSIRAYGISESYHRILVKVSLSDLQQITGNSANNTHHSTRFLLQKYHLLSQNLFLHYFFVFSYEEFSTYPVKELTSLIQAFINLRLQEKINSVTGDVSSNIHQNDMKNDFSSSLPEVQRYMFSLQIPLITSQQEKIQEFLSSACEEISLQPLGVEEGGIYNNKQKQYCISYIFFEIIHEEERIVKPLQQKKEMNRENFDYKEKGSENVKEEAYHVFDLIKTSLHPVSDSSFTSSSSFPQEVTPQPSSLIMNRSEEAEKEDKEREEKELEKQTKKELEEGGRRDKDDNDLLADAKMLEGYEEEGNSLTNNDEKERRLPVEDENKSEKVHSLSSLHYSRIDDYNNIRDIIFLLSSLQVSLLSSLCSRNLSLFPIYWGISPGYNGSFIDDDHDYIDYFLSLYQQISQTQGSNRSFHHLNRIGTLADPKSLASQSAAAAEEKENNLSFLSPPLGITGKVSFNLIYNQTDQNKDHFDKTGTLYESKKEIPFLQLHAILLLLSRSCFNSFKLETIELIHSYGLNTILEIPFVEEKSDQSVSYFSPYHTFDEQRGNRTEEKETGGVMENSTFDGSYIESRVSPLGDEGQGEGEGGGVGGNEGSYHSSSASALLSLSEVNKSFHSLSVEASSTGNPQGNTNKKKMRKEPIMSEDKRIIIQTLSSLAKKYSLSLEMFISKCLLQHGSCLCFDFSFSLHDFFLPHLARLVHSFNYRKLYVSTTRVITISIEIDDLETFNELSYEQEIKQRNNTRVMLYSINQPKTIPWMELKSSN